MLPAVKRAATKLAAVSLFSSISACTFMQPPHHVTVASPTYDPTVSARVRFLTGNGTKSASFKPNSTCYRSAWENDADAVQVDDGYLAAWKYSSQSVTIGMPPSPRPWMRVDGLQFKDMIKEYVVDAGKPMTVSMLASSSAGNVSYSCRAPSATFTPQAGHDYDVFEEFEGRRCWMSVREIDTHGLDQPVTLVPAAKCASVDASQSANHVKTGP
jgi:hypothetical protein